MGKFLVTLPGHREAVAVMAPSKMAAVMMVRDHLRIPSNVSVMGAKIVKV